MCVVDFFLNFGVYNRRKFEEIPVEIIACEPNIVSLFERPRPCPSSLTFGAYAHADSSVSFQVNLNIELQTKHFLVVDDSPMSVKMVVKLLEIHGATCESALDGHFAVAMVEERQQAGCEKQPFDVVLMDNLMPVMSGVEACRQMRKLGYRAPIFGLTGHALPEDIRKYEEAGANCVFRKPLDIDKLIAQVLGINIVPIGREPLLSFRGNGENI